VATRTVLGIALTHNSTACVLVDGHVVACASEERFDRIKNSHAYPMRAARAVLDQAGLEPGDLDRVVHAARNPIGAFGGGQLPAGPVVRALRGGRVLADQLVDRFPATEETYRRWHRRATQLIHPYYQARYCADVARRLGVAEGKVALFDHHEAHAFTGYAFALTPERWDKPILICTLDAEGDERCATVNIAQSGQLRTIAATPSGHSIGILYAAVTSWLGMKADEHEYKVMGLAPYAPARPAERVAEILSELVWLDGLVFRSRHQDDQFPVLLEQILRGHRFDAVAAGVQLLTERLVTAYVQNAVRATGVSDVVLSGGVFMNVKANKAIMELPEVSRLTVCPSAGDESTPIGAAFGTYCQAHLGERLATPVVDDLYLGTAASDVEVKAALAADPRVADYELTELTAENEAETIADLLAAGEVVARLAGRMEFGARALGNRSILADPSRPELVRTINDQIKGRDFWMPFACTILAEAADRYVVNPDGVAAPYMALAFDTAAEHRHEIVAGIHPYDATVRPQILEPTANGRYAALIRAFAARRGIPAVLNTSFNLHGEPIVCTAADALDVFARSGLRALQLEHWLIRKRADAPAR
jgi:carbamoyltransferase